MKPSTKNNHHIIRHIILSTFLLIVLLSTPAFAREEYIFTSQWDLHKITDGQPDPIEKGVPVGIALDSAGNVFVTGYNSVCVQKFNKEGNFIKSPGSYGSCFNLT